MAAYYIYNNTAIYRPRLLLAVLVHYVLISNTWYNRRYYDLLGATLYAALNTHCRYMSGFLGGGKMIGENE